MLRTCCLAGIDADKAVMFGVALREAGEPATATVSRLDVTEPGKLTPDLVVCDIDILHVDPLEMVRRLRLVLLHGSAVFPRRGRQCSIASVRSTRAIPFLGAGMIRPNEPAEPVQPPRTILGFELLRTSVATTPAPVSDGRSAATLALARADRVMRRRVVEGVRA